MIDVDTFGAIREVLKERKKELAAKKELSRGASDDFWVLAPLGTQIFSFPRERGRNIKIFVTKAS